LECGGLAAALTVDPSENVSDIPGRLEQAGFVCLTLVMRRRRCGSAETET